MTLAPGATLQQHRYVIRGVLEQNDVHVTYLADHVQLEQVLRLESLNPQAEESKDLGARCQQLLDQGRQLSRCSNPHLAGVRDAFVENGLPYVALEHFHEPSLHQQLRLGHLMSQDAVLSYIRQVASAVQVLHDHGLVHGNIRPETVVRSPALNKVVLTGIRFQPFELERKADDVRSLAALLWALLTAQPVSSDLADRQVLAYRLRQTRPALASGFEEAIALGLATSSQDCPSVHDWLVVLPHSVPADGSSEAKDVVVADSPASPPSQPSSPSLPPVPYSMQTPNVDTPIATSHSQPAPSDRPFSVPTLSNQPTALQVATTLQATTGYALPQKRSRKLPLLFTITALTAGFAGAGAGVAMRLNTPLNSVRQDAALFNRDQTFPPSQQWPGESMSEVESTSDFLFEQPNSVWTNTPSYYPPATAPLAPSYVEPYSSDTVPSYEPIPELEDPTFLEDEMTVDAPVDPSAPPLEPSLSEAPMPEADYNTAPVSPTNIAPAPPVEPPMAAPPPPLPDVPLPVSPAEPLKQKFEDTP